jgi:hypothetical protein
MFTAHHSYEILRWLYERVSICGPDSTRGRTSSRKEKHHSSWKCVLNDSVTGKQSGLAITQREACAVASAANTSPDSQVYLMYTCSTIGNLGHSPEYVKQMLSYPNVRIWKLVISDYIKVTPLETCNFMGKVRSSNWPVAHASDILRFITLWRYGGTYVDTDVVIWKWVLYYRLQNCASCPFIIATFLNRCISVGIVNGSRLDIRNAGLAGAAAGILPEWLWFSPFRLSSVDSDCEFWSWPWQWFVLGWADRPLHVSSPVKNTLSWSAELFSACKV